MTTLLFLLLLVLALRALGRGPGRRPRDPAGSWSEAGRRLARDVLAGVRALSRLAAARRDRVGSPWS
ncbi:hypothetical protein [Blastococcus xanthinilyticus]|uniref:hypothetical protein n=1 Tax=Blastococcus xanthinilyticus TaxID=1564164 RepID=UPI001412B802|nr:hypothetical protein [Blastococcus xanthinilyticus]